MFREQYVLKQDLAKEEIQRRFAAPRAPAAARAGSAPAPLASDDLSFPQGQVIM